MLNYKNYVNNFFNTISNTSCNKTAAGSIVKSIIAEKHISEISFYITKIVGYIAAVLLQILYQR